MENNKKMYFNEVDVARTIGIFLVVLGHSFPDASSINGVQPVGWRFVYYFIYSFHMPLFIFLSGFVSGKYSVGKSDALNKSFNKFKRLMVPYFIWGLLYIPFRIILAGYSSAPFNVLHIWKIVIGENPYSGLWFLYALFFVALIHIWLVRSDRALYILLSLSFLMLVFAKYVMIAEPVKWIFLYLFYYLVGVLCRNKYKLFLAVCNNNHIICITSVLFIALFLLNYYNNTLLNGIRSILVALLGIFNVYFISYKLKKSSILVNAGGYGMDIFILSGPFLVMLRIILFRIMNLNYSIYVVIATFLGFICPIYISKTILRKNMYFKRFLLGMWN